MSMKTRKFTDQEFDIMIEQLLVKKPASFDMLYEIANKTLHGWVIAECRKYKELRQMEEDIYHEVLIRLIQKTVTDFLLKDSEYGAINRNPDGFKSWMFTVAGNLILNELKKNRKTIPFTGIFTHGEADRIPDVTDDFEDVVLQSLKEDPEVLQCCVSTVLDSCSQPYIVLTWLAMCVYMLQQDITKIAANHKILEDFFDMSLNDMFEMLETASDWIPWLVITQEQIERMTGKLNKTCDGETVGELPYRHFFIKKEPLSVISDWENRMNSLIKRVIKNEAYNG